MKIRLYNSKNDIVQVLALENGVLIRYDGIVKYGVRMRIAIWTMTIIWWW